MVTLMYSCSKFVVMTMDGEDLGFKYQTIKSKAFGERWLVTDRYRTEQEAINGHYKEADRYRQIYSIGQGGND